MIGMKLEVGSKDMFCKVCVQGKMTRTPFPRKSKQRTEMLEIIHTEICGPMRTESAGKAKYFLIFTDDASRWCEVKFLRDKSEALAAFRDFKMLVHVFYLCGRKGNRLLLS